MTMASASRSGVIESFVDALIGGIIGSLFALFMWHALGFDEEEDRE